jgi:3-deoxy-D-manno-octulosonic-acid transferase
LFAISGALTFVTKCCCRISRQATLGYQFVTLEATTVSTFQQSILSVSQLAQTPLESLTMSPTELFGSIRRRNEPPPFVKQTVADLKLFILEPLPYLAASTHKGWIAQRFIALK